MIRLPPLPAVLHLSATAAALLGLFLAPQPLRLPLLIGLQTLFLVSALLPPTRRTVSTVLFFVVLLAGIVADTGEPLMWKHLTLALHIFTGYLVYYFFKSVREETAGNVAFIQEERQKVEFQRRRLAELESAVKSLREQNKVWQRISAVLQKASGLTAFPDLCEFYTVQAAGLFRGSTALLCLKNTEAENPVSTVQAASSKDLPVGTPSPDNLDEIVADKRIPVLVEDAANEMKFRLETAPGWTFGSAIAAPVAVPPRLIGALKCYDPAPGRFRGTDLRLLQYLAESLSAQLLNSVLLQEAERLARTDGVTGLYVQHSLMEKIHEEIDRHRHHGSVFSLVILDLDDFKAINDTYGHLTGDFVLAHVADQIRACVRSVDFPARYGGDEFVLVLPETDTAGAVCLAERLRHRIHESSAGLAFNGVRLGRRLSVSIGAAAYKTDYGDVRGFLDYVDRLMYHAKRTGKNRVVSAIDLPAEETPP